MSIKTSAGQTTAEPLSKRITSTETALAHTQSIFCKRAQDYINGDVGDWLLRHGISEVCLAGGALMHGAPADLDLFAAGGSEAAFMTLLDQLAEDGEHYGEAQVGDFVVQLCREPARSLQSLIDTFDFAHCQVGVRLQRTLLDESWVAVEVFFTHHFTAAMLMQGTYYVGGKWPLRSLARVPKIATKLNLSNAEARSLAFQVTTSIAARGMDSVIADDPIFAASMGVTK